MTGCRLPGTTGTDELLTYCAAQQRVGRRLRSEGSGRLPEGFRYHQIYRVFCYRLFNSSKGLAAIIV